MLKNNMTTEELETAFQESVALINNYTDMLPADFLLRLYAYYKRATNDSHSPGSTHPLINAFKTNALFQTRGITPDEAKRRYVKAVKDYFETNF